MQKPWLLRRRWSTNLMLVVVGRKQQAISASVRVTASVRPSVRSSQQQPCRRWSRGWLNLDAGTHTVDVSAYPPPPANQLSV